MNVKYYPAHLSALIIDDDLEMGAHDIILGAAQTVDGVDVSGHQARHVGGGADEMLTALDFGTLQRAYTSTTGTDIFAEALLEDLRWTNGVWVKVKEIYLLNIVSTSLKISYTWKAGNGGAYNEAFRVYKNGAAVGTQQNGSDGSWHTFEETIAVWARGDLCQLYVYCTSTPAHGCYSKDFKIIGTVSKNNGHYAIA